MRFASALITFREDISAALDMTNAFVQQILAWRPVAACSEERKEKKKGKEPSRDGELLLRVLSAAGRFPRQ
jgi:hypothetical protein